jgi:DNA-binding CsgD family transcriptional regulator
MKKLPALPKLIARFNKQDTTRANSIVFCEKSTGVAQFEEGYGPNLHSNIERVASMLAMQCLVRGCEPLDYAILVPAKRTLAARVTGRAKELLEAGMAAANPVPLSPRQQEILHAVVRNSANKEIAAKFNITVRTVKFHISTLFSKFGVDNRVELARKATGVLRSRGASGQHFESEEPNGARQQDFGPRVVDEFPAPLANRTRNMRLAQRVLSA